MSDIKATLLDLEERFWLASGKPEFYEAHAADQALYVMPFGTGISDKDETMNQVADNARPWKEIDFKEVQLIDVDDEKKVLIFHADAVREDGSEYHVLASSLYVKTDGGWKLLFHQQTPASE